MIGEIAVQLVWVLCFMIVGGTALTAFGMMLYHDRYEKRLALNPKKRTIIPNKAYAEPGICMCGEGLNFHLDGRNCQVEGCPCVIYIPSDADDEMLAEIGKGSMARLAIDSVNRQLEHHNKLKAIETQKEKEGERPCQVCGSQRHTKLDRICW